MNKVYEIKRLDFALCEHDPRAQSVCEPSKPTTFNEFQKNVKRQLKKIYDTQRSNPVKERI
jgi:hypothetical protein